MNPSESATAQMVFLKEFFNKVYFVKKSMQNFPIGKELSNLSLLLNQILLMLWVLERIISVR